MPDEVKKTKKSFQERYKRITQSDVFKEVYDGASLGDIIHIKEEKD